MSARVSSFGGRVDKSFRSSSCGIEVKRVPGFHLQVGVKIRFRSSSCSRSTRGSSPEGSRGFKRVPGVHL